MPRPDRIHIEGGVHHVSNRLGRGERVFDQDEVAVTFARLLRAVVRRDELQSRFREQRIVRAREMLVTLGAERYCLKVEDLAREFGKTASGVTQALARGIRRRRDDGFFRADLGALGRALAEAAAEQNEQQQNKVPGTFFLSAWHLFPF